MEEPLIQEINSDSTSTTPVLSMQSSPSAPPPKKELAHGLQALQHAGHHLQTVSFQFLECADRNDQFPFPFIQLCKVRILLWFSTKLELMWIVLFLSSKERAIICGWSPSTAKQ